MITYYGYTISPNQLETGEGFLICRNVPIARTGTQQYLGSEIGMNTSEVVDVMRTEEEVFSPAAIASFEGKPVTNDHPPVVVDPNTAALYEKGHIQNVRRGSGEFKNFLVGDLHIHDAELIKAIKNGKRQISCGYECEYIEKDGQIYQTNIRGNHVAVVDEGRAGVKASIMDSIHTTAEKAERNKKMGRTSTLFKLFGLAANGKSDEELNKLALDAADALEEQAEVKAAETEKAPEQKAELSETEQAKVETNVADQPEAATLDSVSAKLDKLIALLTPKEAEKAEVEVETKEDIDSAIEKLDATGEEAAVVSAEEMDEKTETDACGKDACGAKDAALDQATQSHILKTVREAVAGITDEKQRQAVTDAMLKAVRSSKNDLAGILKAQNSFATSGSKDTNEDIQARYASMNPHNKKEA